MKKRVKLAARIFVVFIVFEITAVKVYERLQTLDQIDGLERRTLHRDDTYDISYLVNPEEISADAQRILYVHGTPGSASAFKRYLLNPIDSLDGISIDRPGFGGTHPHQAVSSLHEQAQAIAPFLTERDHKWPLLVGHSLGAPIICQVAAEYPEKVGGLVILSGALDPGLEKIYWYQRVGDFAFVPHMLPRTIRNANRELFPLKAELEVLKPLLEKITCPVVILHAPNDVLVPYDNVAFMKEHFTQAEFVDVVILEGKNHFIPWNSEQAVRDAITRLAFPPAE